MPRESIVGSGRKGFGFEQKGFQERNLALLLDTLSKKETQKSIEALSKIDKDEWSAMATTVTTLNNFITLGGASTLVTSIKETIQLQIDSLFSGLTNEINQAITDILAPFLADKLQPMINDLNTFLSDNVTGAGIGGIVGSITSLFLPGGQFWVILGAVIGAFLETGYNALDEGVRNAPEGVPYHPDMKALYEAETGNVFISIFHGDYIIWYRNRQTPPTTYVPGQTSYSGGR